MNQRDIAHQIFNHLNLNDIIKCSAINKLLKEICDFQYVRLFDDYENIPLKFFVKISFKQMYITCYELDLFLDRLVGANLVNFFSTNKLDVNSKHITKLPELFGQLV